MIEVYGCFLGDIIDTSPDDGLPLEAHVKKLHTSSYAVSEEEEDAAIGISEATKCEIIIHATGVKPQRFSPKRGGNTRLLTTIQIVFI